MENQAPKTRRTAEQWSAILEEFQLSAKTVTEFCVEKEINPSQLYLWRKRLTCHQVPAGKEVGPFIEVQPSPTKGTSNAAAVAIDTVSGQRISISELPSSTYMVDLIRGL
jgi:transposase-like protein